MRARSLAQAAEKAAGLGDFAAAVANFKAARDLDPRAEYVCNVGVAYYGADDWARAHVHLSLCLRHSGLMEAVDVAKMRRMHTFTEERLRAGAFAPIDLRLGPMGALVQVDWIGPERLPGIRALWLPLGRHVLRVSAEGYRSVEHTLQIDSTSGQAIVVSLEKVESRPAERVANVPVKQEQPKTVLPELPADTNEASAPVLAYAAYGAGAVALVVGATFHVRATQTVDDLKGLPVGMERDELIDTLHRQRWGMGLGYGFAAVGLGVGAFLHFRHGDSDSANVTNARIQFSPWRHGGTVAVQWSLF